MNNLPGISSHQAGKERPRSKPGTPRCIQPAQHTHAVPNKPTYPSKTQRPHRSKPHHRKHTKNTSRAQQLHAALPKSSKRKHFHYYRNLPSPKLATYNVCTYRDGSGSQFEKLQANLSRLGESCDAIFTQETRDKKLSPVCIQKLLGCTFDRFCNPHTDQPNSGGTDIFIRKDLLTGYDVRHKILCEGYIHAVDLDPKDSSRVKFTAPFTFLNIYLPHYDSKDASKRELVLSTLFSLHFSKRFLFMAGDFNFTEHKIDSTGPHAVSTKKLRERFQVFCSRNGLREIHQPTHTCIRPKESKFSNGLTATTSRIDRVYCNYTPAETELMKPMACIPELPFPPPLSNGPSDHLAVRASFSPPHLAKHTRFKIPEHVADNPEFLDRVRHRTVIGGPR